MIASANTQKSLDEDESALLMIKELYFNTFEIKNDGAT